MRIGVVTSIPTPYRDRFWNALASRDGIELHVFYCARGKPDRPWSIDWPLDFSAVISSGVNLSRGGADSSLFLNLDVVRFVISGRFDAIIVVGYTHPTMFISLVMAKLRGIPYYLMCESHSAKNRPRIKRLIKWLLLRPICAGATGGLPTGKLASEYLRHYGLPDNKQLRLPNVPDVIGLRKKVDELILTRESHREDLGIPPGTIVILFAGRLIRKKRADLLVRALARLPGFYLVLIGDGDERAAVEELAVELGVKSRCRFEGFIQPSELPRWYASADVFALLSNETWGVVVAEALTSGLPIVVSNEVGSHPDFVTSATGVVVDALDADSLATAITSATRLSRGDVSSEYERVVKRFAYEHMARRLHRFVAARRP